MLTTPKIASMLFAVVFFASCERSSRSIEVQPNNNNIKPTDGSGSGKDPTSPSNPNTGTNTNTDSNGGKIDPVAGSGEIRIVLKSSSSSSKVSLQWSYGSLSGTEPMTLVNGTAAYTIRSAPVGKGDLKISGTLDGKAFSEGSSSVTVTKDNTTEASFELKVQGGGSNNGGEVVIVPEIKPNPNPNPNPNPPVTPQPSVWDGKSFKGNAKWSIEAIN